MNANDRDFLDDIRARLEELRDRNGIDPDIRARLEDVLARIKDWLNRP